MIELQKLPHLADLFRRLRGGWHVCADDGPLHRALTDNADGYGGLFTALGYSLKQHRKGFFYFEGKEGALADAGRRIAIFMFILIESFGDSGRGIEECLFGQTHAVAELPHLKTERYRGYMADIAEPDDQSIERILAQLEAYGFATRQGLAPGRFRFRAAAYRFLDVCSRVMEAAADAETAGAQASDPAEAT